ncbi:MAG: hypothetical protein JNL90_10245 [Planctomycetes bacterium]|nr:hypothetical protein [Planctomycetota bacterium]
MPSCFLAALLLAAPGVSSPTPPPLDQAELKRLAERCGSQIAWIRDLPPVDEAGGAFQYVRGGKKQDANALNQAELPAPALKRTIGEALSRAQAEGKLVLWHVWRLEGGQMYRAPLLDDYMDQCLWSDPELVALVNANFVPLRTRASREVGAEYGLVAWDQVEPALLFLSPQGKVVHAMDRLRTFDPRWFAEVLKRVLAAHPELDPEDPKPAAADAFATPDAGALEQARAAYFAALADWSAGRDDAALAGWKALIAAQPDTPYAWRAAANFVITPDQTPAGAARHAFEGPTALALPPPGELPRDTRWRRKPAEAEAIAEDALRWLLRTQRADGSWNDCRYAYWNTPAITPNAWMAITALAASALLEWRDLAPDEVDGALARAEDYLFGSAGGRLNVGENEECYAHAYRILYVERVLAQTEDAPLRASLQERLDGLVKQLVGTQRRGGQWAHEYDNAFCSGVALEALRRAKSAGATVPDDAMKRGLDALQGARFADGTYAYGGAGARGGPSPHADHAKDSSGRMPLCEAELVAAGRSDAAALGRAFAAYKQFYDRFEKISKCDFHTDGELGGFFFFHDLYHSSAALAQVPAAAQAEWRRWFLEKLAALPEIDGSFLDDHELGKSCATAYALLALKNALAGGAQ